MIQPGKENRHNKSVCLVHGPGARNTCCGEQCFSFCVNFCHVFSSGLSFGKQKRPSKFTRWKRTCGKIVSEKVKISFKCGLGTVRQYHFIVSGYFPLSQKFWTFKTGKNGTWNILLCVQKKSKTLLIFQNANHSPFWEENQMEQKCPVRHFVQIWIFPHEVALFLFEIWIMMFLFPLTWN